MWQRTSIGACLAMVGVVLLGCREEEQDRPLTYQKGSYQGQADAPLTPAQVETLRQRTAGQRF